MGIRTDQDLPSDTSHKTKEPFFCGVTTWLLLFVICSQCFHWEMLFFDWRFFGLVQFFKGLGRFLQGIFGRPIGWRCSASYSAAESSPELRFGDPESPVSVRLGQVLKSWMCERKHRFGSLRILKHNQAIQIKQNQTWSYQMISSNKKRKQKHMPAESQPINWIWRSRHNNLVPKLLISTWLPLQIPTISIGLAWTWSGLISAWILMPSKCMGHGILWKSLEMVW